MNHLTAIPVVAEQTIKLFALFDAFHALGQPGSTVLHESATPGAAAALDAWAASRGLTAMDRLIEPDDARPGYVNRQVPMPGSYITVCHYRELTDAEVVMLAERDRVEAAMRLLASKESE